jgi:nucleoside-diphosphate-sugar epimerase
VNQLFDGCRRVAGVETQPTYAAARPGDALRSVVDVSRSERELGWRPQTPLEEGLRLTWG